MAELSYFTFGDLPIIESFMTTLLHSIFDPDDKLVVDKRKLSEMKKHCHQL